MNHTFICWIHTNAGRTKSEMERFT